MEHIKAETMLFPVTRLFSIRDRGLEVVLVRVGRNSSAAGKPIGELSLPLGSVISLLIREGGESEIPTADVVLKEGNQLICLVPTGNISSLQAIFRES